MTGVQPQNFHFSTVGRPQALQALDGRCFSRAVGADESEDLAAADLKGNAVDRGQVAVRLA